MKWVASIAAAAVVLALACSSWGERSRGRGRGRRSAEQSGTPRGGATSFFPIASGPSGPTIFDGFAHVWSGNSGSCNPATGLTDEAGSADVTLDTGSLGCGVNTGLNWAALGGREAFSLDETILLNRDDYAGSTTSILIRGVLIPRVVQDASRYFIGLREGNQYFAVLLNTASWFQSFIRSDNTPQSARPTVACTVDAACFVDAYFDVTGQTLTVCRTSAAQPTACVTTALTGQTAKPAALDIFIGNFLDANAGTQSIQNTDAILGIANDVAWSQTDHEDAWTAITAAGPTTAGASTGPAGPTYALSLDGIQAVAVASEDVAGVLDGATEAAWCWDSKRDSLPVGQWLWGRHTDNDEQFGVRSFGAGSRFHVAATEVSTAFGQTVAGVVSGQYVRECARYDGAGSPQLRMWATPAETPCSSCEQTVTLSQPLPLALNTPSPSPMYFGTAVSGMGSFVGSLAHAAIWSSKDSGCVPSGAFIESTILGGDLDPDYLGIGCDPARWWTLDQTLRSEVGSANGTQSVVAVYEVKP